MYRQSRFSAFTRTALRGARRHWMAISIPIAIILMLAYAIAFLIDEPLTSRSPKAAAQRGAATRMRTGVASDAARKAAHTRTRRRRTRR